MHTARRLFVALAPLVSWGAHAHTLDVPSAACPDLASAVALALAGDTIQVAPGWVPDEPAVVVSTSLTLRGDGGIGSVPALIVGQGVTLTLEEIALRGSADAVYPNSDGCGSAVGVPVGLCVLGGTVNGRDVVLDVPDASGIHVSAGRVEIDELMAAGFVSRRPVEIGAAGSVTLTHCVLTDNAVGAIHVDGGDLFLTSCSLAGNTAEEGADIDAHGALVAVGDSTFVASGTEAKLGGSLHLVDTTATLTRSDFSGYRADRGGVVAASVRSGTGAIALDRVTVIDAEATTYGGGLHLESVDLTSVGLVVADTSAGIDGGVLWIHGGDVSLKSTRGSGFAAGERGGFAYAEGDASVTATDPSLLGTTGWLVAQDGGAFALVDASLEVDGGMLRDLSVTGHGGGILVADGSITLRDVVVEGLAAGESGGAIYGLRSAVVLDGTELRYGVALTGGAVALEGGGRLDALDSLFLGNAATDEGGALHLGSGATGQLIGTRLCGNASVGSGAALAVTSLGAGGLELRNSVVMENLAVTGGAVAVFHTGATTVAPRLVVVNNTLLDNIAPTGSLYADGVALVLTNNVIAGSDLGVGLPAALSSASGGYNLWYGNFIDTDPRAGVWYPTDTAVRADPQWIGHRPGDCSSTLYLDASSPARDAGDPSILDRDGSRSDIGSWGGPLANLPDEDQDGWTADLDCDDTRAAVAPGLPEVAYDGIDQDCDGADLCDVDGDGFFGEACGGPDCVDDNRSVHPAATEVWYDATDQDCDGNDTDRDGDGYEWEGVGGTDCNDGDPRIHPAADDAPNDDVDQDCSGSDARALILGGGGCATPVGGSGTAAWVAMALLSAAIRRNRRYPAD